MKILVINGNPKKSGFIAGVAELAVNRLVEDVRTRKDRSIARKAAYALDRFFLKRLVFRGREDLYANVLRHWKDKGYLS
jgi:hypothetical protein